MKNLTALLLTLTLAFFSISGCEPIGKETSDSVPTPPPFIEECLEGPLKLEIVAEPEYKPVYTGLTVTLWPVTLIMLICESIWKGICNFGNLLLDITRKRRK